MTYRAVLVSIGVVAFLAGCAGAPADPSDGSGPGSGSTDGRTPAPSLSSEKTVKVNCDGIVYDPAELAHAPLASSLPAGPAGAVIHGTESPAFDPSRNWKVIHQSEDRVELVRELDEPQGGGADIGTHAFRILERSTGSPNTPPGTWLLRAGGRCAQRLVTNEGLEDVDLALAKVPSPSDTSINLLVDDRTACGPRDENPQKRIELLELTETADQVRLRIDVRPVHQRGGICPPLPSTPFTVELRQPLGDREIVDASVVPPRPVPVN